MRKRLSNILGIIAISATVFMGTSFVFEVDSESGRIKVYLQNKCSEDVKVKVASPGSSTQYTVEDGTKKPMSFVEGTKIYNSSGSLAHEVSSSSEGEVVVVCD